MKIAIISTKPASLNSGAEVRNYYLLQGLKHKFEVDYYMPQLPDTLSHASPMSRITHILTGKVPYIEYFRNATFDDTTLQRIKQADVIQLEELESFFAVEKYIKGIKAPIVLDAHNIEYLKFLSDLEKEMFPMKLIGKLLAQKVRTLEIQALKKIHYLITCSKVDEFYFSQYFPQKNMQYIPNGVDCTAIEAKTSTNKNNVLFMGLLSYGPNEDGIKYYLKKIHPLVKKRIPDIKITIIGKNAPTWLIDLSQKDKTIELIGFVNDVREYIYSATICICPIRSGSGTRLKVLEYMAAGKAVVSTKKGSEGINCTNNVNILLADTPTAFADAIINLNNNYELYDKISRNARKLMMDEYDWSKSATKLITFYNNLENRKDGN